MCVRMYGLMYVCVRVCIFFGACVYVMSMHVYMYSCVDVYMLGQCVCVCYVDAYVFVYVVLFFVRGGR